MPFFAILAFSLAGPVAIAFLGRAGSAAMRTTAQVATAITVIIGAVWAFQFTTEDRYRNDGTSVWDNDPGGHPVAIGAGLCIVLLAALFAYSGFVERSDRRLNGEVLTGLALTAPVGLFLLLGWIAVGSH